MKCTENGSFVSNAWTYKQQSSLCNLTNKHHIRFYEKNSKKNPGFFRVSRMPTKFKDWTFLVKQSHCKKNSVFCQMSIIFIIIMLKPIKIPIKIKLVTKRRQNTSERYKSAVYVSDEGVKDNLFYLLCLIKKTIFISEIKFQGVNFKEFLRYFTRKSLLKYLSKMNWIMYRYFNVMFLFKLHVHFDTIIGSNL